MVKHQVVHRHRLLLYERAWNRLWQYTLPFGILFGGIWLFKDWVGIVIAPLYDALLFVAALLFLLFATLTFLTRRMATVQTRADHLRVVTPLFRFNVSFRRLRGVQTSSLEMLFPPKNQKGADRALLEPFYGSTVVVVNLNDYPVSLAVLRFFLPYAMLSPKSKALVLLVQDWMKLVTEIDSARGEWQQNRSQRPALSGYSALYGDGKRK